MPDITMHTQRIIVLAPRERIELLSPIGVPGPEGPAWAGGALAVPLLLTATPTGPGATQGLGSPLVVGSSGNNTIEVGGLEIQAYGPTGDPYILYLNFEGGAVNIGKVDETVQFMEGRIIQGYNGFNPADIYFQKFGNAVYFGNTDTTSWASLGLGRLVFGYVGSATAPAIRWDPNGLVGSSLGIFKGTGEVYDDVRIGVDGKTAWRFGLFSDSKANLTAAVTDFLINNNSAKSQEYIESYRAGPRVDIGVAGVRTLSVYPETVQHTALYDYTSTLTSNMVRTTTTGQLQRSTSSQRFKSDIVDLPDDDGELMNVRPVRFTSDIPSDGDTPRYGFIAEELAAISESYITRDNEGNPAGVELGCITARLWQQLRKARNKIMDQQAEIDTMRNQLQQLHTRVLALENA